MKAISKYVILGALLLVIASIGCTGETSSQVTTTQPPAVTTTAQPPTTQAPTTAPPATEQPISERDYTVISIYDPVADEYLDGDIEIEQTYYGATQDGKIKLYFSDIPDKKRQSQFIEPKIAIHFSGYQGTNQVEKEWYLTKTELMGSDHELSIRQVTR